MSLRLARPEWALEIERLRGKLNLSQAGLAKILNVSAMAPSRWERGINEPTGEIYIQLGKLAGTPQCWNFWRRAGLEKQDIAKVIPEAEPALGGQKHLTVPIVKATWNGILDRGGVPPGEIAEQIIVSRSWCQHSEQIFCFWLQDESMAPEFPQGFLVAIDLSVNKSRELMNQFVATVWQGRLILRCLSGRPEAPTLIANDHRIADIPCTRATPLLGKMVWWMGRAQSTGPSKLRKAAIGSATDLLPPR